MMAQMFRCFPFFKKAGTSARAASFLEMLVRSIGRIEKIHETTISTQAGEYEASTADDLPEYELSDSSSAADDLSEYKASEFGDGASNITVDVGTRVHADEQSEAFIGATAHAPHIVRREKVPTLSLGKVGNSSTFSLAIVGRHSFSSACAPVQSFSIATPRVQSFSIETPRVHSVSMESPRKPANVTLEQTKQLPLQTPRTRQIEDIEALEETIRTARGDATQLKAANAAALELLSVVGAIDAFDEFDLKS